LSRAYLGKMMTFIYKWLKKCRFLTFGRLLLPILTVALDWLALSVTVTIDAFGTSST
jgi:hypothetical protein